jgi:hypothetical protein
MKCKTCPICGSNIDFGERCDCEKSHHDQPEMETARRSPKPRRRKPAYNSPEYLEQQWREFDCR